ncbi:MAG: hypothetical protein DHS20C01_30430 [marine bacterium B5-7]|nr:MAG: hypothetical protein DHS20C01_30430 [marine bacterium B5-7]
MAVTSEVSAPYAPASGMLDIINRYRHRGMQSPINAEVLGRAGISDSLISRTLQALLVLDLIDEEGNPTDTFEGIRLSPEEEYKQRLQEWLRSAYADVFSYVDPMEDDDTKIRDAFRTYKPMGQQNRMVSLFIGLCEAAGLREEVKTERKKLKASKNTSNNGKTVFTRTRSKKVPPKNEAADHFSQMPSAIAGLMKSLPTEGQGWQKERRDQFLVTFGTVLDFCFPIIEKQEISSDIESEN